MPYIAHPKPRDNKKRPPKIPESIKQPPVVSIKEIQEQNGGAGVYSIPI